jgi:uncharacterized membrane protein YfcA
MEIFGYAAAILMGLALGLIGGGGSILTVPILVYLFAIEPVLATAYSLFIVGITSLVGSFSHVRLGNIHWKTALVFGLPSIVSVYLTRLYLVPFIPQEIPISEDIVLSKPLVLLVFFAVIMVLAAYSMIRKPKAQPLNADVAVQYNFPMIFLEGLVVGIITGLVGAGGGFLIIPALVILARLPMKQAVGTSLIIIAAKSLIGFVGDLQGMAAVDWYFLLRFSAIAVVGILLGTRLSLVVPNEKLKPAFGWFVLVMGVYIISKELWSFIFQS